MESIELYRVIDNPDTYDRYTLCFMGPDGPFVYGANENPFHPLGFGQFVGDFYVPEDQDIGEEISRDHLPAGTLQLERGAKAMIDFILKFLMIAAGFALLFLLPQPLIILLGAA